MRTVCCSLPGPSLLYVCTVCWRSGTLQSQSINVHQCTNKGMLMYHSMSVSQSCLCSYFYAIPILHSKFFIYLYIKNTRIFLDNREALHQSVHYSESSLYLDSQTPPVQAELVGQEDRVRPDTYRGGRERDNHVMISARQNIHS